MKLCATVELELGRSPITLTGHPATNVVEVSLFGPGRGESAAIHLGEGRWIVVDSCVDSRTKRVPVLEYLSAIGVDVTTQVRLVVATHAHDDHFAGIARIFEACRSATFVCPAALSTPEFFALTDLDELEHAGLPIRAYSEYRRVFQIIDERIDHGLEAVQYALPQRHLYQDAGQAISCDVLALSPSDKAFRRAMRAIRKAMPRADVPKYIEPIDPNELSIALWVRAGDRLMLLGADMLKGPNGSGWHAVLSGPRPPQRASVFKVSHHGSSTGHRGGVWSELLLRSPIALLTPYRSSGLPKDTDCRRILNLTDAAYITAAGVRRPLEGRTRREAAAMGTLPLNVRELDGPPGQIRARSVVGAAPTDWAIDLGGPGRSLSTYLAELESSR